jgi:hypothetical protein
MTDPRNEIDDWLGTEVTPLSPPPGALDRIRHRARRRKTRQVVIASAGCAVVVAAAVAVPRVLPGPRPSANQQVAGSQHSVTTPAGPNASAGTPAPEGSGSPQIQGQQRTQLSTTTSGTAPPPHFRPTSVTFVGDGQGGFVGAVIGQAGPPCATQYCTSLAGTSTYGKSWYGVSAPEASDVNQLRFGNLRDGWAYGPGLYQTSNGGWPWNKVDTAGQTVIDLEASGQSALAVFATCSGTAATFLYGCTSFELYGGSADSTAWAPVAVPVAYQHMSTSHGSWASIVISGRTGYLLTPSGVLLSGPVSGGTWTVAGQAPCPPLPGGAPSRSTYAGGMLAAAPGELQLVCAAPASSAYQLELFTSADGTTWHQQGTVPVQGILLSVASAAGGQIVIATTAGIYYSADDGVTWHSAAVSGPVLAGGFSYVGMTDATDGVAVPADPNLGAVYITHDRGQTWSKSPIAGATTGP